LSTAEIQLIYTAGSHGKGYVGAYTRSVDVKATNTTATSATTNYTIQVAEPTISWTGAVDNNWNTAGNWDLGRTPNATDRVFIGGSGAAITSTGTVSIANVVSHRKLSITGGSFTVAQPSLLDGGLDQIGRAHV